ncbi:MAG: diacylglycerol kinase family lipid kinase [Clostridiales bacterium]|nr:diacylglycerol kinase family lipid kinase [Clostridiales bacterium]
MGLRIKIIMNPSSGRERARANVEDTIAYLSSQKAIERADISYTAGPLDATRYAMDIRQEEYDLVMAVGGDGTVNEVVTGMLKGNIDLPLAVYTSGTVNDFASFMKLPSEPSDFARMLMSHKTVKVDCGKVNDRYFLNVLAGGLLSAVAYKVPSDLKTNLGPVAYWIEGLKEINSITKTIPLKLKTDNDEYDINATMFLISNTRSVGGFKNLMLDADLHDGLLDVLVISKVSYMDAIPLLNKIALGEHLESDKVLYFQTSKLEMSATNDQKVTLDIDGEKGPKLPATIECIRDAINLVIPSEEALL